MVFFTGRYAPFLFCKECIYCKEQDTLSIIPPDEMCIPKTANDMTYVFTNQ